jgi:hypothetical protein
MRPLKFPLSAVTIEHAARQYRADLLAFFKGRFGRAWERCLRARGIDGHCLRNTPSLPATRTLRTVEKVAVELGFRPYVGRVANPFERNSREYWPRLTTALSRALWAPTCAPSVGDICSQWMNYRSRENLHSDVLPTPPSVSACHCSIGNGICSPMPAPEPEPEHFDGDLSCGPDSPTHYRQGGQSEPPFFAHWSPRAIKKCSRPSFCALQNESLTASCL